MHDFEGTKVNRRRPAVDPVLESYKFIPHLPTTQIMTMRDAAKFFIQLFLENTLASRLISVEIDNEKDQEVLSQSIFLGLCDMPMITPEINFLTSRQINLENVNVQRKDLSEFEGVNVIVKSQCIFDSDFLSKAKRTLSADGFIVSRESHDIEIPAAIPNGLELVATIPMVNEVLLLLQFIKSDYKKPDAIIKVTSNISEWLEPLKKALKTQQSVLAYSEKEICSGIIGLTNCIRKELQNASSLRCVLIEDSNAPTFDINHSFYESRLKQGMSVNVFKNNQWGSYRHLQLTETVETKPRAGHYYAKSMFKGDLSSLSWIQGSINVDNFASDTNLVKIQYSALNFRDVMQASGKISFDFLSRIAQQNILGFEFSGVKGDGRRIFGMGKAGAFATYYDLGYSFYWDVPDHWTMEEAASVPLVYVTVYTAFFQVVTIKRGQSVLIHAGSGGVGLAALHVAFHYGLEVFTTCSTQEKRDYLLKEFPMLKTENIGNSRDTSFEQMIKSNTKGRGVDYVLNSLSEDKLLASIRCLADYGTFLEIGQYDIMNKTKIDMSFLTKNIDIKAIFISGGISENIMENEVS